MGQLEYSIRDDLNRRAPRVMAVLNPVKVIIDNYPEGQVEMLDAENNPEDESAGTRQIPFSREIYIEREDFMEDPPRKFFRLAPGREVRLKHAYYVQCERVVKDETGEIVEIHCTYDPETRGGWSEDGRKVEGHIALGFLLHMPLMLKFDFTIRCLRNGNRRVPPMVRIGCSSSIRTLWRF